MLQQAHQTHAHGPAHAFPANLDEQLAALRSAGFTDVDCFWKDLRQACSAGTYRKCLYIPSRPGVYGEIGGEYPCGRMDITPRMMAP